MLKRIEELENQIANGTVSTPKQSEQVAVATPVIKQTENTDNTNKQTYTNNIKQTQETGEVKSTKAIQDEPKPDIQKNTTVNDDIHSLWVSIVQSIESVPNRAFYSNLARPVEISKEKIVIAFSKEIFVKQAKEGSKKQALIDAVSGYLNIPNPNIEVIISENIDLTKKTTIPPPVKKREEEQELVKQEEEAYHNYVESQKEEQQKPVEIPSGVSSQAEMVKELFDGKYIE